MNVSDYFEEFNRHLIDDEKPSGYFNALADSGEFPADYPFSLLLRLKDVPQSPVHHPEGDVWNHTMLVVDKAAERRESSRDPRSLMWGALLHDLGKAATTKTRKGKLTAYEHDVKGEKLARSFLNEYTRNEAFTEKVCSLVRWHMQPFYVVKRLPYSDLKKMASETDANEIALLSLSDRLGRGDLTQRLIDEEYKNVEYFLYECDKFI
jgi:tRNA nucleotidyltransferase (CCA-adding enzyme)